MKKNGASRASAEQALKESEEWFRDFEEIASGWFWETDAEHRFTRFFGESKFLVENLTDVDAGKTRFDLRLPDDTDNAKWHAHRADLDAGRPFNNFQFATRRADGAIHHVRISGKPIYSADGEFCGYRGTASDITNFVEADERARSAQERLAIAIEGLSETLLLFDAEDRLVISNRTWREFNQPVADQSQPGTLFEDILRAQLRVGLIHEAKGQEETWLRERLERHRNPKGPFEMARPEGHWLLVNDHRLPDGGVITIATDITNLKQTEQALKDSEQSFRRLLESTNAIPWEADARTWMFTYIGPQMVELLGYPRKLWLEKDFWAEHIHPEDRAKTLADCLEFSTQRENYEFEYRMIAADGRAIWFQDIVNVVKQDGEPVILRGFMIDITERKSLEESQRNLSVRLINAHEEERVRISRELHDDFSQRLALLALDIQQLGQTISEPECEGAKSTDKLWTQVQEISTDLHRLSHQLHPAILDQLGLVPAIRSLCGEISRQHDIQIKFTDHEISATISSDIALCLYRAVQEGLRNIVKHSGAKDAKVELTGGPHKIELSISDRGVGFDPKSTSRKGLGLVSIKERVLLLKGEALLQSRPSHGTRIDIAIPVALPDD